MKIQSLCEALYDIHQYVLKHHLYGFIEFLIFFREEMFSETDLISYKVYILRLHKLTVALKTQSLG